MPKSARLVRGESPQAHLRTWCSSGTGSRGSVHDDRRGYLFDVTPISCDERHTRPRYAWRRGDKSGTGPRRGPDRRASARRRGCPVRSRRRSGRGRRSGCSTQSRAGSARSSPCEIAYEGTWVIVSDPELVKQVFTGDPKVFHAGEGNEILRPLLGEQLAAVARRRPHMSQRKLLLPPFHGERMQGYEETMPEIAAREIESWPTGVPYQLRPRMQAMTLEIILETVFGVARRRAPGRAARGPARLPRPDHRPALAGAAAERSAPTGSAPSRPSAGASTGSPR